MENITQHDWLENIKTRYLMQVFVDEATDLSAVQSLARSNLRIPGCALGLLAGIFVSGLRSMVFKIVPSLGG